MANYANRVAYEIREDETYHSFPRWPDLLPLDRWASLLKKSLEKVGERRELVVEEFLITFLSSIDELVELSAECGLCVLTHQLLEFDDRLKNKICSESFSSFSLTTSVGNQKA